MDRSAARDFFTFCPEVFRESLAAPEGLVAAHNIRESTPIDTIFRYGPSDASSPTRTIKVPALRGHYRRRWLRFRPQAFRSIFPPSGKHLSL
jgi:hypothetical protein